MRPRRSPKLIVIGLLCIGLGVGGLALAWQAVNQAATVLVTTRPLAAGQLIEDGDIASVKMRLGENTAPLPPGSVVVGQVAQVDLPTGSVLVEGMVGPPIQTSTGNVRMGVVVETGRLPIAVMVPGVALNLCGASGQIIAGWLASTPQLLPDAARYSFDVTVAMDDAVTLAQWVADGTLMVAVG